MILTDKEIARYQEIGNMIDPFVPQQTRDKDGRKVISYGLSSFGYDIRIGDEIYETARGIEDYPMDPKDPTDQRPQWKLLPNVTGKHGRHVTIRPHGFALGVSMERFAIPRDVLGVCLGKSTYARCGLIVNVTPLEPDWQGFLTIELHNTTTRPVRVYIGEGIAQILFHKGACAPMVTYADRAGKYQGQPQRPVFAKV